MTAAKQSSDQFSYTQNPSLRIFKGCIMELSLIVNVPKDN